MSYSPILVPVLALILWWPVSHLIVFLLARRSLLARCARRDRPTRDEISTLLTDRYVDEIKTQPTTFYTLAIILAAMGLGRGMDLWVAWAFAALWIASSIATILDRRSLRRLFATPYGVCNYGLAVYACAYVINDSLFS